MKKAFKSYAQNFEDLMLYRALGWVEHGFYIDVGAQHPEVDSVSKAFFDRGWRGVHIEPVPHYANLLREARPGDQVIEAAVSDRVGHTTLTVFPDTGLSTAVPDIAAAHIESGLPTLETELEVPTITLSGIAEELGDREVHWLKIDVEGLEKDVLRGWDPATLRPWVVVVESTLPNSQQSNHSDWEALLTEAGYAHIYSDGLNRFYAVAEKVEQLKPAFELPPNVFDDVQLGRNAFMCRELSQDFHEQLVELTARYDAETRTRLGELAARYESEVQRLQKEVSRALESRAEVVAQLSNMTAAVDYLKRQWQLAQHQIEQSDLRHQAMLGSLSWRLTSPLRRALDFLSLVSKKKKSDPAPTSDLSPAQVVDHQPALSPGARAWLARMDSSDQGGQT